MEHHPPIYGFDIETDTSRGGLDPRHAAVVAVAVSDGRTDHVFTGPEAFLLTRVDEYLADLAPGVLATWNGAAFDLPFLADRAHRLRLPTGLRLAPDTDLALRTTPLAGHQGAYRAAWHRHTHLDAYRIYRAEAGATATVSCSLKAVARRAGLRPIEVDRETIHLLDRSTLAAYVASDARLTRELARRRWPEAASLVDDHRHRARPPAHSAVGDAVRHALPSAEVAVG